MTTLNISQKNVSDGKNTFFKNNRMLMGTEAPTSGTYTRGDVVVNTGSDNDKNNMWICIESGSPGEWILIGGKPMITSRARVVITDPIAEVPMTELGMPVEKDDKLDVYLNSTHLLEGEDYTINSAGTKIRKKSGIWNLTGDPAVFDFVLMKYVDKVDGNNVTINTTNRETKIASIIEKVQIIGTQTEVAIPNINFNQDSDTLLVFKNGMIMINGIDYQISNGNLVSLTGPWNQSNVDDYEMTFILLKEVLVYEGGVSENFQEKTDDSLQTENKTIVGAINELFQSANNGKELIASAIGEPLNAEDTFSAMSNDINSLLSTFKANMMNSGVIVESGDGFKQLIDKIKGLTEGEGNKGIQYAEGVLTDFTNDVGYSTSSTFNYDLTFVPTILFVAFERIETSANGHIGNVCISNINTDNTSSFATFPIGSSDSKNVFLSIKNLSSNSFTLTYATNTPSFSATFTNGKWYAIGIGESGSGSESGPGIESYDTIEISSSDLYQRDDDYYHYSLESYDLNNISFVLADVKAIDDDIGFTQYYSTIVLPPDSPVGEFTSLVGNYGNAETSVTVISSYDSVPIMKTTDNLIHGTLTIFHRAGAVSNSFSRTLLSGETTQYTFAYNTTADYYTVDLNSIPGKFDYIYFTSYASTNDANACNINIMYDCNSKKCYYLIQGYYNYGYQFEDVPSNAIPILRAGLSTPLDIYYSGFVANGSTIGSSGGSGSSVDNTAFLESLKSVLQGEGVSVTDEDDMASLISKVDQEFDKQVVPVGTATASDVLSGKTFINSTGQTLTGSMRSFGSYTYAPDYMNPYVASNGTNMYVGIPTGAYLNTTSASGGAEVQIPLTSVPGLNASNIKKGTSILGVPGTLVAFQTIQYQGVGVYSTIAYNGATYTGSVQYNSSGIYNYPVIAVCTYDMTVTSSYKLTDQVSTITFDATAADNVFQNGGSSGSGSVTTSLDMSIDRSVSGRCSFTLKVGGNGGSIYVNSVSLYMLRP